MRKAFILGVLCVSVLFGNTIVLDNFTITSTTHKNKNATIEIYKNDKLFQEIADAGTGEYCDVNFLFSGIYGEKDRTSIGYKCDSKYNAIEYNYDPEKQKYAYQGPLEWLELKEIRELKDFFITMDYDYDGEAKYGTINVLQKPSNRIVQTIALKETAGFEYLESAVNCVGRCFEVGDYNFDGLDEFSLYQDSMRGDNRAYFLYDPDKKTFFLSEIGGANLEFDYQNKIIRASYTDSQGIHVNDNAYKIVGNKMQLIDQRCYMMYYEHEVAYEHKCGEWYDDFLYFTSVGLKNNFALVVTLNADKTKGAVLYHGQKEFINIVLNAKNGSELIFDEITDGKINGKYVFVIKDENIQNAFYVNNKGRKFQLEAIE